MVQVGTDLVRLVPAYTTKPGGQTQGQGRRGWEKKFGWEEKLPKLVAKLVAKDGVAEASSEAGGEGGKLPKLVAKRLAKVGEASSGGW